MGLSGVTFKYLLGLFYMGMEPINNTSLVTNKLGFIGNPIFIVQQAIGGGGVGMDFGFTTIEFNDGYRFSFSIINLFGTIKWKQNHFMRKSLENTIENSTGDYYLKPNEFLLINFMIDSLDMVSLNDSELMYYETYKVIPLDSTSIPNYDSELLIKLNNGTFLYPSGGKYKISDLLSGESIDSTMVEYYPKDVIEQNPFKTRQPILFRMGISRNWHNQAKVSLDLITGFSNRFGTSSNWKLSLGAEVSRFENKLLRFGYSFGGLSDKSISFGYAQIYNRIQLDFGISLNGGFTVETMKGIDFGIGVSWEK